MRDQKRSTRRDFRDFVEMTTRWNDNDPYGHMNNAVYYEYFDTAVNRWLIARAVLDIAHSPVIGLVVESGCHFFAPLGFPDRISGGLRVTRLGETSVIYEIGLFRGEESAASAQGRFVHVYVSRETRRPAPLPAPLRAALADLAI